MKRNEIEGAGCSTTSTPATGRLLVEHTGRRGGARPVGRVGRVGLDSGGMESSSARMSARYEQIERLREQMGDHRRRLSPDEGLALVRDVWGEPDPQGVVWARRVLGLGEDSDAASA